MNTPMNLSGARALAVGAGLTLALAMGAAPTAAMAEVRVGTTDVTVKADISNVSFKAPTVIPFAAQADGTLVGPSDKTITIDNLSAYGIHVTNMKVTAKNSIDFKVGPDKAEKDASSATQTTGLDLSKDVSFDMKYKGIADGTDKIKLNVSGHVARVTRDIYHAGGTGDQVASITWTVEPGVHTA